MESISDVVDEVIQNCPIDVRRPLYKVRAAQASAAAPGPRHGARQRPTPWQGVLPGVGAARRFGTRTQLNRSTPVFQNLSFLSDKLWFESDSLNCTYRPRGKGGSSSHAFLNSAGLVRCTLIGSVRA